MVRKVTDAIGDVATRLKNWADRRQDSADLAALVEPTLPNASISVTGERFR